MPVGSLAIKLPEYLKDIEWHCHPAVTEHGIGLIRNSDQGNAALTVPPHLIVTREAVLAYAEDQQFRERLLLREMISSDPYGQTPLNQTPTSVLLLHFLLFQIALVRRGTPDPRFGAWIRALPPGREINAPFVMREEEIEKQFSGTSVFDAIMGKLRSLKKRYAKFNQNKDLIKKVAHFVITGPGTIADEQEILKYSADLLFSFEDFVLCEEWISSRALGSAGEDVDKFMCPGMDLANHSDEPNSAYDFEPDGSLVLYTTAVENEEVQISYGHDKGAGEFLFNYGFIPRGWRTAKKATFFFRADDPNIREIFGAPAKGGIDEDVSYDMLIRFLERPMETVQFRTGGSRAHGELLFLVAARDFLELLMVDQYYELHFVGHELDLERIEYSVRNSKVYKDQIEHVVQEYSRKLAAWLYGQLEKNTSGNGLVELEKELLKEFL